MRLEHELHRNPASLQQLHQRDLVLLCRLHLVGAAFLYPEHHDPVLFNPLRPHDGFGVLGLCGQLLLRAAHELPQRHRLCQR